MQEKIARWKIRDHGTGEVPTAALIADLNLMENVAAAPEGAAMGHGRVKLLKFRFEMLVNQQEGFQRAADVAIATRHNLVNGRFARSGCHRKSSICPWN